MVTIARSSNANPNFEITNPRTVNASAGSEGSMKSDNTCNALVILANALVILGMTLFF